MGDIDCGRGLVQYWFRNIFQVESSDKRKAEALRQVTTVCDRLYSAVGVAQTETATTLRLVDRVCKLLEHKLPSLTPTETHL